MNPAELRYLIYKLLGEQAESGASPELLKIQLVHPVAGMPGLMLDVVVSDPYSSAPDVTRTYQVQIVEV